MSNFLYMVTRIAGELRRSNLTTQIKAAVNDAILEASKIRFWLNEVRDVTFATVDGTEYYDDQNMVELDAIYLVINGQRRYLRNEGNVELTRRAEGTETSGEPYAYSRVGSYIRLYPIPDAAYTVKLEGSSRLTPYPLVNDTDTNNWLTHGERYIRALAKRNVLRDVVQDYGEAAAYDATAEDAKAELERETTTRVGTGRIRPTSF